MNKRVKVVIAVALALLILLTAGLHVWFLMILPERERQREQQEFFEFLQQYYKTKSENFANENKTLGEVDVAFIGDSLTDGYDLATYYPGISVINRGIGGDTTHGVYDRLEVSVIEPAPKVIVMMIGTNNLGDMFTDYEDIILAIRKSLPDTHLVLLSIPPSSDNYAERNGQIAINNVKIKSLAEAHGCTYVDVFTPLFDFERDQLRAEYTTDGLHFTPLGYSVITAEVKTVLEELLD